MNFYTEGNFQFNPVCRYSDIINKQKSNIDDQVDLKYDLPVFMIYELLKNLVYFF